MILPINYNDKTEPFYSEGFVHYTKGQICNAFDNVEFISTSVYPHMFYEAGHGIVQTRKFKSIEHLFAFIKYQQIRGNKVLLKEATPEYLHFKHNGRKEVCGIVVRFTTVKPFQKF